MKLNFLSKVISLTAICALFCVGLFSQNLLNNPGFENGIDNGWLHVNTSPAVSTINTHIAGNTYFQSKSGILKTTTTGTQFWHVKLENTKSVTGLSVGQEYVASIWAKAADTVSNGTALKISLKITNASGEVTFVQKKCILTTYYQRYEVSHTITSDFLSLKYQIYTGASAMGVYIDNAQYEKKTNNGTPVISSLNINDVEVEDDVFKATLSTNASDPDTDNLHYAYDIVSGGGSIGSYGNHITYEPNGATGDATIRVTVTDNNGAKATKTRVYSNVSIPDANYYLDQGLWNTATGGSTNPAYRFTTNNPNLPNVLLIGTSISIGYTNKVQNDLSGKANVYRIPDNSLSTVTGRQKIEYWLSNMNWSVIHFNWGLHDLKYSNGVNQDVSPADYETNMRTLVNYMKNNTNAKLIWASTTIVPSGLTSPKRNVGDDVIYNNRALSAMSAYTDIAIDDQYTLSKKNPSYQRSVNVHFTTTGYNALGAQAANTIRTALEGASGSNLISRIENELGTYWLQSNTVVKAVVTSATGDFTKWEKIPIEGNDYYIKNVASGKYLASVEGSNDVIEVSAPSDKTIWKYTEIGSNYFIDNTWKLDKDQYARLKFSNNDIFLADLSTGGWVQWKETPIKTLSIQSVESLKNISNNKQTEFKLFPNPSEGSITLGFENEMLNGTWSIFNCLGQLIKKGPIDNSNIVIDMEHNKGVFFLYAISDGKHTTSTFIVKQ